MLAALAVNCSPAPDQTTDELGVVKIALSQTPADAQCLEISAQGSRSVTRRFTLAVGVDATLEMAGLPLGPVQFSARAFGEPCDSQISTEPQWVSEPVSATIVKGEVSEIALILHRNGRASISVGFCDADVLSDVANCGACQHACPAGPFSQATCTAGACGLACDDGHADCNQDPADGCEVTLASDPAHCGTCSQTCAAGAFSYATCTAGACGLACDGGRADCNQDSSDGCEVGFTNDPANCGTCGHGCATGQTCTNGVCSQPPATCGECTIGAETCDFSNFGPIFCVNRGDGCGQWGPRPFGGCNGIFPYQGVICETGFSPWYCTADAAGCRVERQCPSGQVCAAPARQPGNCQVWPPAP